jgi:hypothetical protein
VDEIEEFLTGSRSGAEAAPLVDLKDEKILAMYQQKNDFNS